MINLYFCEYSNEADFGDYLLKVFKGDNTRATKCFCSLEEAFLAGYKRTLEDAVDIMKEIKQNNSQSYN